MAPYGSGASWGRVGASCVTPPARLPGAVVPGVGRSADRPEVGREAQRDPLERLDLAAVKRQRHQDAHQGQPQESGVEVAGGEGGHARRISQCGPSGKRAQSPPHVSAQPAVKPSAVMASHADRTAGATSW